MRYVSPKKASAEERVYIIISILIIIIYVSKFQNFYA